MARVRDSAQIYQLWRGWGALMRTSRLLWPQRHPVRLRFDGVVGPDQVVWIVGRFDPAESVERVRGVALADSSGEVARHRGGPPILRFSVVR